MPYVLYGPTISPGPKASPRSIASSPAPVCEAAFGPTLTTLASTLSNNTSMNAVFRPAAAVLDFNLHHMNGLQLLRHLRAVEPGIKVIMASGDPSETLPAEAMDAGAYEYLPKPFALSELRRLLDRAMRDDACAGRD